MGNKSSMVLDSAPSVEFLVVLPLVMFAQVVSAYLESRYPKLMHHLPEVGVIIILGMLAGAIISLDNAHTLSPLKNFSPELFFVGLLPPIIFNSGFHLKRSLFFCNVTPILCFAVIGTLASAALIGIGMYHLTHWANPWTTIDDRLTLAECFTFGALISATDPVSTLVLFAELRVEPHLFYLVFGESVMNDAVGVVLFDTAKEFIEGTGTNDTVYDACASFVIKLVGSSVVGVLLPVGMAAIIRHSGINHRPGLEQGLVVLFIWVPYLVGESLFLSGIVATLAAGMASRKYIAPNLTEGSEHAVIGTMRMLSGFMETAAFLNLGLTCVLHDSNSYDSGMIIWAIVLCFITRPIQIYGLSWILNKACDPCCGKSAVPRKIDAKTQHMLSFSGLRGVVAFACVAQWPTGKDQDDGDDADDKDDQDDSELHHHNLFKATTSIVILFTVFVQGGLTYSMLEWLNIEMGVDENKFEVPGKPTFVRLATALVDRFVSPFAFGFLPWHSRACRRRLGCSSKDDEDEHDKMFTSTSGSNYDGDGNAGGMLLDGEGDVIGGRLLSNDHRRGDSFSDGYSAKGGYYSQDGLIEDGHGDGGGLLSGRERQYEDSYYAQRYGDGDDDDDDDDDVNKNLIAQGGSDHQTGPSGNDRGLLPAGAATAAETSMIHRNDDKQPNPPDGGSGGGSGSGSGGKAPPPPSRNPSVTSVTWADQAKPNVNVNDRANSSSSVVSDAGQAVSSSPGASLLGMPESSSSPPPPLEFTRRSASTGAATHVRFMDVLGLEAGNQPSSGPHHQSQQQHRPDPLSSLDEHSIRGQSWSGSHGGLLVGSNDPAAVTPVDLSAWPEEGGGHVAAGGAAAGEMEKGRGPFPYWDGGMVARRSFSTPAQDVHSEGAAPATYRRVSGGRTPAAQRQSQLLYRGDNRHHRHAEGRHHNGHGRRLPLGISETYLSDHGVKPRERRTSLYDMGHDLVHPTTTATAKALRRGPQRRHTYKARFKLTTTEEAEVNHRGGGGQGRRHSAMPRTLSSSPPQDAPRMHSGSYEEEVGRGRSATRSVPTGPIQPLCSPEPRANSVATQKSGWRFSQIQQQQQQQQQHPSPSGYRPPVVVGSDQQEQGSLQEEGAQD